MIQMASTSLFSVGLKLHIFFARRGGIGDDTCARKFWNASHRRSPDDICQTAVEHHNDTQKNIDFYVNSI